MKSIVSVAKRAWSDPGFWGVVLLGAVSALVVGLIFGTGGVIAFVVGMIISDVMDGIIDRYGKHPGEEVAQ